MTTTSYSLRRRMTRARRASYGEAPRRGFPRLGVGPAPGAGPLLVLLGAWGGAVAYFGPLIGLGPAGAAPWRMTTAHTVLNLVPGAAAVAGGLAVTLGSRLARARLQRSGAVVALAAAAWFVIGFAAYPALFRGGPPAYGRTGGGPVADLGSVAAYGRGVGLLLCALAAVALVRTAPAAGPILGSAGEAALDPADDADDPTVPVAIDLRDHVVAERQQGAAQQDPEGGGGWRPQLRPRVTRLVPGAAAGAEASSGAGGAPTAVVPRPHLVASPAPAETGWRPRFMTNPVPIGSAAPAASLSGAGIPAASPDAGLRQIGRAASGSAHPSATGWLRSGEWVLAHFGELELRGGGEEGDADVSAAVTNRRVVVASGGRPRREWSLEALVPQLGGPPANPIPLAEDASLDFADPAAARDFAMAVRAAGQARATTGRR